MPLSDNEQRLLEQMERALYAEDPKFASTMRGARRKGYLSRMLIGIAGLIVGIGVLLFGVAKGIVLVGVVGFLIMLAGTVFAFSSARRRPGPAGVVTSTGGVRAPTRKPGKSSKGTFMQRMEQRWDRRRDQR